MTDLEIGPPHTLEREITTGPMGKQIFRVKCKCGWKKKTPLRKREQVDQEAYQHFWNGNLEAQKTQGENTSD